MYHRHNTKAQADMARLVPQLCVLLCAGILTLTSSHAYADGNRYKYPREYKADISPVVAARELERNPAAVLIDVRSVEEFVDGHAPLSSNIPYPRVAGKNKDDTAYKTMSPEDFLAAVRARHADPSTPIMLMCQSGGRSAMAANILAKAGYTNVRSVWTGYAGLPLKDTDGNALDINANGIIHGVTLGPDGQPMKDLGDLDGWAGFNDLPVSREIAPHQVLDQFRALYQTAKPAK
jgi:rhodanese-related sulfurtransferase